MTVAAWTVAGDSPVRLAGTTVGLESDLESWIAADPGLVDRGLVVLERQLRLGPAGRLDLLCVDQQGRLVLLEIKRSTLMRDVIAQALDYASVISGWSVDAVRALVKDAVVRDHSGHPGVAALIDPKTDESPDLEIILVGCGTEASFERMVDFLATKHGVAIRSVTFDVFSLADGQRVLVRDEHESEDVAVVASKNSLETVLTNAGGPDSPDGRRMRLIASAAERAGLYARPYRYSIMLTPPQNRTRYLGTLWHPSSGLVMGYSPDAFAEFFPIGAAEVRSILGPEELRLDSDEATESWAANLEKLFAKLSEDSEDHSGDET